jgi:serine/threonine-protein kinase RsbT
MRSSWSRGTWASSVNERVNRGWLPGTEGGPNGACEPDARVDTGQRIRMVIREEADVAVARKHVRQLAPEGGLSAAATHALTTAVSEIARNIVIHAGAGELVVSVVCVDGRLGLLVIARDTGPGIPDLALAMRDGYSTAGSLGLGLASAARLVNDFDLASAADCGTTVTLRMWAR